jgi:hypothetical protein
MKKFLLIAVLACISTCLFAHANAGHTRNTKNVSHPSAPTDSIFVIKAANPEEATAIANKCPIYEMDDSVEIRPIINTTN